jgi:hypothetical protein
MSQLPRWWLDNRRRRGAADLAARAADAAFSAYHADAGGAAIARWWLAERWLQRTGDRLPVAEEAVNTARTQALIGAPPADPRSAAMLAEVAARTIGDLVLLPASMLDQLRERRAVGARREAFVWRALAISALTTLLFVRLAAALEKVGMTPSDTTLKAAGAIVAFVGAFLAAHFLMAAYRADGRAVSPAVQRFVDGVLPFLVALLTLFAR